MATARSNRPSPDEIKAIIASLLVEKNGLLKVHDQAAADAIAVAIDYWLDALAKAR